MKFLIALLCVAGFAVAAEQSKTPTLSGIFDSQLSTVEKEVISLAEAMPAEKYDFAPTSGEFKGVRTFGVQLKHLAATNYGVAATLLGGKPVAEIGADENGPANVKSKEEILAYVRESFAQLHKGYALLTGDNYTELVASGFGGDKKVPRGAMANIPLWHCFDHYGQMVVYARMNGIVPPASRQ